MAEQDHTEWGNFIYGLETAPLPKGYTALSAEAIIKCLDAEGKVTLLTRGTHDLMIWDSVGMLTVALDAARERAKRGFVPDDEDEQ